MYNYNKKMTLRHKSMLMCEYTHYHDEDNEISFYSPFYLIDRLYSSVASKFERINFHESVTTIAELLYCNSAILLLLIITNIFC